MSLDQLVSPSYTLVSNFPQTLIKHKVVDVEVHRQTGSCGSSRTGLRLMLIESTTPLATYISGPANHCKQALMCCAECQNLLQA